MLEIQGLRYHYRAGKDVLRGVTFSLKSGETMCLLGPNGTGKTTLLRCILGFNRPQSGDITLNGTSLIRLTQRERAKRMAYVPQSSSIAFSYEAREVVLMGRIAHLGTGASHSKQDKQIAMHMMALLEIENLASRSFQELSGGERQMVIIARTLAQESSYLILDEPTANLDYSNQVRILKVIRGLSEHGYGILMTSHYPDHAFLACSKAVLMRGGQIMSCGAPDDTVTTQALSELYQTPVCVSQALAGDKLHKVCIPLL